jgi:hypothetical protein
MAGLWWSDARHDMVYDARHGRMGALPFIFIGLSFICFQLSLPGASTGRVRGLMLGLAFALWGSEQFLPASGWLTLLDNLVITIFVVDLGLIMGSHFCRGKTSAA